MLNRNENSLGTLPTDSPSQLDILWHDRNTLGMDGTQIGVFKQSHEVGFGSFLWIEPIKRF